jgi:DnaJ-class molecular chaperone
MDVKRWEHIAEAGRILRLPEDVTRSEIQEAYRRRCRELHPDRNEGDTEDEMTRINAAYRLLMDYCDHYRIKLEPNENGMTGGEWWMLHFGQDPIWHSEE